ncbi:virulence factor TspB C-terminal domain-related protein [Pseudomonas aeruginosa]|uniref:virulence factor TspB C-terminal domain-related protein n=1 Tax=Pseudomonas aeruginosa TaxID=287 RepID=UPI003D347D72
MDPLVHFAVWSVSTVGLSPDKQFSLSTGGGHSFTFSYKPLCAFASDLGVLIVVAASIFATLYVGRGFGGE